VIRAWRIVKRRYLDQAFDGEGARIHGGRWNSPGQRAVYLSESRALATLEVLAGLRSLVPLAHYALIGVRFDAALVTEIAWEDLPESWASSPPGPATQSLGDRWLSERRSVVLRVPSVVLPAEHNYVLNPLHVDFQQVQVGEVEELRIDPRLVIE
jgi:RES domain-containing protein